MMHGGCLFRSSGVLIQIFGNSVFLVTAYFGYSYFTFGPFDPGPISVARLQPFRDSCLSLKAGVTEFIGKEGPKGIRSPIPTSRTRHAYGCNAATP
jgi:hypothetical protein